MGRASPACCLPGQPQPASPSPLSWVKTAETKLLLELSLCQLQEGSLPWSLFSVPQLLMGWTGNGASLPAAGKANQANGGVGPHR